jgi:transmembrane sensor
MNPKPTKPLSREEIERTAAQWVLRRDRGLTATEQDELSQWLAADSRHGEALALQRWGWDELDRLAGLQTSLGAVPDPDLFAPRAKAWARRWWWIAGASSLAAAAAVALLITLRSPPATSENVTPPVVVSTALAAPCERLTLEDGSVVELNRGAAVEVVYSATERRVRLVRGEANFTVAKNPERPFVVNAGGVDVRAVGTVFNVRLAGEAVEVVVSEGRVKLENWSGDALVAGTAAANATGASRLQLAADVLLSVGQSAVVLLVASAPGPQVNSLAETELAARLAWQPRLLDFTGAPLSEIVAEFNRRNPVQLAVDDATLGALRLSAAFRSDNVEGFVRLMESDFGMRAEWRSEREIVLRRAK